MTDGPAAALHAEALALAGRRRWAEAETLLRRAVALAPGEVAMLADLAAVLQSANRPAEAEPVYAEVLRLAPDHVPALRNLAVLLKDGGRAAAARALAERALRLAPSLGAAIQAHPALSPVSGDFAQIAAERRAYAEGLERLAAEPFVFAYEGERLNLPWYYLAYQGEDDRALLERTAAVVGAKVSGLAWSAPHLAGWTAPAGRRLRIGFCSEFLRGHTVGHLFGGFVRELDRDRFEVAAIHGTGSVRDPFRQAIDAAADHALALSSRLAEAQRQIAGLELDVLVYPDIGMSAQTWMLAHARLAPVQALSWGHPDTSGLQSLDYFLSCDAIEPAGAEAAYSERLVRMRRLPSCYPRPAMRTTDVRGRLGLAAGRALYACPQTLFKFHPAFDEVLAGIAAADPDGEILLIAADNPLHTEVLRARWAKRHPGLAERVRFLPRLGREAFLDMMATVDVLLDPLHFGSGNTLYEAFAMGTPIVTWPGAFARSRIVAAAYRQIGVSGAPVADSAETYVRLAVQLAHDRTRRAALAEELGAKSVALFDDARAVRELEAFALAAVAAADQGERLPAGWRPDPQESAP
jgi:predicted O-linked N-acetylglucosamine transferase (SPINDLY family)